MEESEEELKNQIEKMDDQNKPEENNDVQAIDFDQYNQTQAEETVVDPLDQCPPDFEWAKIHGKANKVNDIITKEIKTETLKDDYYCKCCHLPTEKLAKPFDICTNVLKLEDLGSGFPLYYQFKAFTIIIYIFMTIIAGIAGLSINLDKSRAEEWDQDTSFVVKTSIGNHGKHHLYYDREPVHWMQALNLI